jgi:hypothetical protein
MKPTKPKSTKSVSQASKSKAKSTAAKKPGKGGVAIDTVPLPEKTATRPKLGKVTSKATPGKAASSRSSLAKTSVTGSKMAKKPIVQSKRPVIRSMNTLRLEPGKTQTITLLGTNLDKITAVQVISNNRPINNVKATLGPPSGTSRSITLTASPNANPGNIQFTILPGSQTSSDINAFAFVLAVIHESYVIQTETLQDHAEKVKAYNEAKEKIREEIKEAREQRNELMAQEKLTGPDKAAFSQSTPIIPAGTAGEPEADLSPEAQSNVLEKLQSETADSLRSNDGKWRKTAERNEIEKPRLVEPGSTLTIPALNQEQNSVAGGLTPTEQPEDKYSSSIEEALQGTEPGVSSSDLLSAFMKLQVEDPSTPSTATTSYSCAALQEEMILLQQQIESLTEQIESLERPSPPAEPNSKTPESQAIYNQAFNKYHKELAQYNRQKMLLSTQIVQLQEELAAVEAQLKLCMIQQNTGRVSVIEPKINDQVSALERESISTNQYVYPTDDPCAGLEETQKHYSQTIANFSLDGGIGEPPPAPRREDFNSEQEYLKALAKHVEIVRIHQINQMLRAQQLEDFKNALAEVEAQLESCRNPTATAKPEAEYVRKYTPPSAILQSENRVPTMISNVMKMKHDTERSTINNIRGDNSDTSQSDQSQEQGEGSSGASDVSEPAKTLSKEADTTAVMTQKLEAIGISPRLPEAASSDTDTTDFNTAQKWQEEQSDGALMYQAVTELAKTAIVESKMERASSAQIQKQADQSSGTSEETGNNSETSDEGIYIGPKVYDGRKALVETSDESADSKHFEVVSRTGESVHTGPRINEYSSTEDYLASLRTGLTLTIWNRSEFELLEVRVHDTLDYQNAPNQLQNPPLPDEGQIEVPFESGQYVTVIRRRVSGGERIAFTTGQGLDVPTNSYTLLVFQQSFRLLPPEDE